MCSKLELDERSFTETVTSRTEVYSGPGRAFFKKDIIEYEKCEESEANTTLKIVEQYSFFRTGRKFVSADEQLSRRSVYDLKTNRLLSCWANYSMMVPVFVHEECVRNVEKIIKHCENCPPCRKLYKHYFPDD